MPRYTGAVQDTIVQHGQEAAKQHGQAQVNPGDQWEGAYLTAYAAS